MIDFGAQRLYAWEHKGKTMHKSTVLEGYGTTPLRTPNQFEEYILSRFIAYQIQNLRPGQQDPVASVFGSNNCQK